MVVVVLVFFGFVEKLREFVYLFSELLRECPPSQCMAKNQKSVVLICILIVAFQSPSCGPEK